MPPVLAYAPAPEVDLLAAYDEYCDRLGLISVNLGSAARTFVRRWPCLLYTSPSPRDS